MHVIFNSLHQHPLSFDATILKARTFIQLYQFNKALVLLSKASKINKNAQSTPTTHEQHLDILFLQAQCYRSLNQNNLAIDVYDAINALTPTPRAYLNKGVCLYSLNLKEEAIANYNKAISLNPNYTEAYFNKGICLSNINKKEETITNYNKCIELNPNDPQTFLQRAYCYYTLGKYIDATRDSNRAIELNRNCSEAFYRRGSCFEAMSRFQRRYWSMTR